MEGKRNFIEKSRVPEASDYNIMSYEEYAHSEHETPYVFELEKGRKKLVYFGARHSNDVNEPMFNDIENEFRMTNPQMVFVEGMTSLAARKQQVLEKVSQTDRATLINDAGEGGLALKLATESGADVESPEPDFKSEIEYVVEKGYEPEDIFAYYMYRVVDQYHRTPEKPSIADYLAPYLREFKEQSNWEDFDYSVEHLEQIGKRIWGEKGSLAETEGSRTDPVKWEGSEEQWTDVNRVSQESSYFRDQFMVKRVAEVLKDHDRVFIVFGGSHAYMQEPALRKMFQDMK